MKKLPSFFIGMKDYYQLLEIPYTAREGDIKKAFRKLAMRYHPDKNVGNPFAIQHFREIKEAYEVLSNPVKRSEYHQLRWKHSGSSRFMDQGPKPEPTANELVREAQLMARQVAGMDIFRMNHEALFQRVKQLLNQRHQEIILENTQPSLTGQFVSAVLQLMQPLPHRYWIGLTPSLIRIAGSHNELLLQIFRAEKEKKRQFQWAKSEPWIILAAVLLICVLIYLIA